MKAKHSVWKNKLAKTMSLVTAILVAALFFGTAAGAGIASNYTPTQKNNITAASQVDVVSIGRAPTSTPNKVKNPLLGEPLYEPFYAVDDDIDMFCSFVPSNPGTFYNIGSATPTGFIQNACFVLDVYWVVDQYGNIYTVDLATGVFTLVGASGITDAMGLAYDDTTGQMFMTAGTYANGNLYEIDMGTGAATLIGNMGNTGFAMISIVCDNDGQLYGAEIVTAGVDGMFYSIDKATGAATQIGSVGFSMNYGQDMEYDKDNDILYFCAFNYNTFMAEFRTIDKTTGMTTFVGNLPGQTTGFGIPYESPEQHDHDISVQSIVKPGTGNAAPITPIVRVKNAGLNTETNVPVQLLIGKEVISGMVDDFEATDGGYTHVAKNPGTDVWQWGVPTSGPLAAHSGSKVWATNLAGQYPASMWCYLLSAPFTVPSGAMLNFWHWYYFESSYDGGNVKISSDGGMTWTLITPEGGYPGVMSSNPYMTGQAAFNGASNGWKQAFFDLSAYEGVEVQLMWECASDSSVQYDGWYIDDVGFTQSSWVNEYTQTMTIASIAPDEVVNLTFPTWTPSGLGTVENVNVNFQAEATNLYPDDYSNNDYKAKAFSLHYGFLNDVKVNEITSPVSGVAQSQVPEVIIENVGQLDQTASVNMVISNIAYGDEWKVWNPSGGNTWVRVTDGSARTGVGVAKCTYEYTALPNDDWLATPGNVVAPGGVFSFWVHGYTYNDDHYHVYISTTGNTIDDFLAGTELYSGIAPTAYTLQSFDLSAYEGQTVYCAIFYDGNYAWYIWVDDVTLPDGTFEGFEGTIFPPKLITLTPEYDQTATVDIAAGEIKTVTLPEWFPENLPVLMNIDYQADVEVTLGGFNAIYNYGFEEPWIPASPPAPAAGWSVINANADTVYWQQYSGGYTGTYCASIGYHYPTNDDWLVTKPITVPGGGGVYSFWWKCGSTYYAEHFKMYYSTSGNTVADFTGPNGYVIGDITYNADTTWHQFTYTMTTPGQVWFAVYCDSADALRLSVDDFVFPDGSTEGFESGTAPGTPGHWASFNQFVYGTTTDQWLSVTSGSSPSCTPPEGTKMAEYNSYNILSGNSAELDGTVLIDFTVATQMKFQMMHDTLYGADYTEVIYPLLSADGVNYWYDGTAFYRYDGTTGWKTETMDYSFLISYLGGPGHYYIGFYAISDFGSNMFIDDIQIGYLGNIPDGDPSNNFMSKMFTLSYEHDVGVVEITDFPQGEKRDDIIWDNYADDGTGNGLSSQFAADYPFQSQCADDFMFVTDTPMDVTSVHWWGIFWNGVSGAYPNPVEFNIIIYADDGSGIMPTGAGMDDPTSTALAVYNFPAVTGVSYGTDKYEYEAPLVPAFVAQPNEKYWIAAQAVFPFSGNGQWGFATNGANPDQLSGPVQGFPLLGTAYWTATTYGDHAFQLSGKEHGGGGTNPAPGTYPIAGIIQNLGATYTEADIPVNAQVTNDTGVVVYDETVVVAGPLAPGELAAATFPDIVIPDEIAAEGDYKLTMKTVLPGDDHPNNDKKTQTWIIQIPDITPPTTTATVSGTMGDDDWYVSNVQVTLTATDGKWPTGVNYTMYKVDDGDWTIYATPIVVSTDGEHTVYFYSVDNAGNIEEEQSVTFKIDKTAPVINEFTATAQNALKNKWLLACDAVDPMSGIVKVEFYADDALVGEVTTTPYEFTVDGKIHTAQCIVYDAAGNSKMSDVITAYDLNSQQSQFISALQQKLL
jgi:hypothetical protein